VGVNEKILPIVNFQVPPKCNYIHHIYNFLILYDTNVTNIEDYEILITKLS
jgi:hypothetical protein